jgi:hypothetical protein
MDGIGNNVFRHRTSGTWNKKVWEERIKQARMFLLLFQIIIYNLVPGKSQRGQLESSSNVSLSWEGKFEVNRDQGY